MTSSPPHEAPHYNGKVTTPESPIPLHIPEPSNIPVLENQIDPIFNLTSTHLDKPIEKPSSAPVPAHFDLAQELKMGEHVPSHHVASNPSGADAVNLAVSSEPSSHTLVVTSNFQPQPNGLNPTSFHQNSLISRVQPSPSQASSLSHFETVPSTSNQISLEAQLSRPFPAAEISQEHANSHEPTQAQALHSGGEDAPSSTIEDPKPDEQPNDTADTDISDGNAIFQTLLDSLSPTTPTLNGPNGVNPASSAAPEPSKSAEPLAPDNPENPIATLPTPAGLPPRPPPQETPAIHPHYSPNQDISSYHNAPATQAATQVSSSAPSTAPHQNAQSISLETPQSGPAPNGLPPPPLASFQQSSAVDTQSHPDTQGLQTSQGNVNQALNDALPREDNDKEVQWSPEVEKTWLEFLQAEAIYVSEGTWDRFPQGSRLFVGNLFTEKASKRDLFFVFHRYGKLAQISIKNAYGFIQFHDTFSCSRALQEEQNTQIRGKKIHLEISKPQKNTRGTGTGNNQRQSHRRSRSPDQGRRNNRGSGQNQVDRYDGRSQQNAYRQRDDYRPLRSPSPRGGLYGRDEYRGRVRSPARYNSGRSRSRSPYDRYGAYGRRSPLQPDFDDEASLPIPRRDPRDVPDVQIVVLDDVDRAFAGYVDKAFKDRHLISHVYPLAPRLSLEAFTKRQILEGVHAVVKLVRQSQITGKIPLQIFDRTNRDNVQFAEYDQLDVGIAAELVVRSKSQRPAAPPQPPSMYGAGPYPSAPPVPQYPPQLPHQSQYPQAPPPQPPQLQSPGGQPANLQNLITSMDGPTLQKLLGAMGQNRPGHQPELTGLLGQHQQQQQQQGSHHQQQPYGQPHQQYQQPPFAGSPTTPNGFANNPALAQILGNAGVQAPPQQGQQMHGQPAPAGPYQQGGGAGQQNVQNIMEQLARYRQ